MGADYVGHDQLASQQSSPCATLSSSRVSVPIAQELNVGGNLVDLRVSVFGGDEGDISPVGGPVSLPASSQMTPFPSPVSPAEPVEPATPAEGI